jgi:ABC-type sugar transport system substrate-binding protein
MDKKRSAFHAALLLTVLLAACAPAVCVGECNGTIIPGTPQTLPAPTRADRNKVWAYPEMVVGFIQTGSEGRWRMAITASFKETAQALGIKLIVNDAASRMEIQYQNFHDFAANSEIQVIVLAALEAGGWEEVMREARDAGKVVVLADRSVDVPEDLYATRVGSDFAEEGRRAAMELCRLLENSEKKNVWELVGNPSSPAAIERGRGFREWAASCGLEITRSKTANWGSAEGRQVMEAFLAEARDVQGIFAQNDEMGLGAIEALKEAGLKPGVDVKIVSIDAASAAFEAMLAGELNAAVECNPLMAPQVYEAALRALNGEILPKFIPVIEGAFRSDMAGLEEIAAGRKY